MRRKDREITDFDRIISVMEKCEVCHVAFLDDEYPYVVPMNFGMDANGEKVTLYFHGAIAGKKHDLLVKNNKVSFAMERNLGIVTGPAVGACECTMAYESIMGHGVMEYITDTAEKNIALRKILDHYKVNEGPDYHFQDKVVSHTAILKLEVREITGKERVVKKDE